MTSRERVLAAARRQPTDRPPTGLRCTAEAWAALRQHLGVATNDDVLDALDVDLRYVAPPFIGPPERSAVMLGSEGTDFWGCRSRRVTNQFQTYFEFEFHPLAEAQTVADIERHDWPPVDWWDYDAVPAAIATANRKEPRAISFFAGGSFESPWYLRGQEQFLIDLYENPALVDAICSRVTEFYCERARRTLAAAPGQIDIPYSGGDVGSQRGMLLDPAVWRQRIKPYSAQLITPFKQQGYTTFYHSCGSIVPVIDDFIEMGLDILDPLQVGAAGMAPEELFPRFGDRLSFHGGIDVQRLLPRATPQQVYDETTRLISILGQRHGYIVAPSHAVQADTPPANIVALFDAARAWRW
ncbi:hypothetical protein HQ590_13225 [bacterium]|nr:hypothetical protein [bacterium]